MVKIKEFNKKTGEIVVHNFWTLRGAQAYLNMLVKKLEVIVRVE